MDELFLTLQRLRLNLLETDLHHRYDIPVTMVSKILLPQACKRPYNSYNSYNIPISF